MKLFLFTILATISVFFIANNSGSKKITVVNAEPEEVIIEEETQPAEYTHTAVLTAYNSVPEQTDGDPCISADGTDICNFDGCVVAQNGVPFGTKLFIDGIGDCEVHDRKNSRYDETYIDIYFGGREKIKEAREFGKQERKFRFSDMEKELEKNANKERTEKLEHDDCLKKVAEKKAHDMVERNYFDHKDPETGMVETWDWIEEMCGKFRAAGENLTANFYNADAAHEALMNSEKHRDNILDKDFEKIAVGCFKNYCVQLFLGNIKK